MTINLNGIEFYSAQEVEERIREAIAGQDKKVDREELPIGTLVKVVGNSAGHCHELGEILPITEVKEGELHELYRLDDRRGGWVSVDDIEFVSFPEEEESTSGDEGLAVDEEVDKDGGFEVGDKAEVISERSMFAVGEEIEIVKLEGDGAPLARNASGGEWYITVDKIKKIDEDESEIKAGDTVIATEDELDITEGSEYEVKEFETGTLYFFDDDGDIRHVSVHEEILRKKPDKRGFKKGDIVYVNEDLEGGSFGRIKKGVAEVIDGALYPDSILKQGDSVATLQYKGITVLTDKLTLVCRVEDRMDTSKEDE